MKIFLVWEKRKNNMVATMLCFRILGRLSMLHCGIKVTRIELCGLSAHRFSNWSPTAKIAGAAANQNQWGFTLINWAKLRYVLSGFQPSRPDWEIYFFIWRVVWLYPSSIPPLYTQKSGEGERNRLLHEWPVMEHAIAS